MINRRRTALMASVLIAGLALVGCGGDDDDDAASNTDATTSAPASPTPNGIEELSAEEILEEAKTAAKAADAVRVAGEITEDDSEIALDLQFSGDNASGTMSAEGATFELLRVGTDFFMKADADTWDAVSGEEGAGELLADRWVKIPSDDDSLGELTTFLDLETLIDGALSPEGEVEKGETTEVDGVQAIGLVDNDSDDGGVLYVALAGEPYPLRIEGDDPSQGSIGFTDWGETVEISAPADDEVIDLSEITS